MSKPTPEISAGTVIRAIRDLGDRGTWPTPAEIASYLEADEETVRAHLRELRRQRLFVDRTRDRRRVWMPWNEP